MKQYLDFKAKLTDRVDERRLSEFCHTHTRCLPRAHLYATTFKFPNADDLHAFGCESRSRKQHTQQRNGSILENAGR